MLDLEKREEMKTIMWETKVTRFGNSWDPRRWSRKNGRINSPHILKLGQLSKH
jgi:hypothetical protein